MNLYSDGLAAEVKALMRDKLLVEVETFEDDLLSNGALDSFGLVQLLVNIEEHFGVVISIAELEIDDIRSVSSIVRLIASRKHAQVGA